MQAKLMNLVQTQAAYLPKNELANLTWLGCSLCVICIPTEEWWM